MDRETSQPHDQRFPTNDGANANAFNDNKNTGDFEQRQSRDERQEGSEVEGSLGVPRQRQRIDSISPSLPALGIGNTGSGFALDLNSILGSDLSNAPPEEIQKVQKRASNVMKLAQENDKLQKELKEMAERLEAAERKKEELERRAQEDQRS
ncbi:hypothetical protein BDV98DRAFT_571974 [Pterulicium gracile]|uniref:Uncharacterized protein n=1 Tax=Pterulicium gracile TaxID=1884261 RepID=A0A5C3QA48_9AGAR|nr:hypothetical protein BDV98DRAFT_571974 [Pterula gracilis]